jgi:CDP-diacylglycerol--serine O-phosphatidyltransferase
MGKLGVAIAVLFLLCTALRLARFNTLSQSDELHKHFVGLPTPASAGVIVSFVLSYKLLSSAENPAYFKTIPMLENMLPAFYDVMPVVMIILSLLMVSNIPYMSFKKSKLTKTRTIELLAVVIVLIILIVVYPQNTIFIIFSVYAASGILAYVPRILLEKRKRRKSKETDSNDV